MNTRKALGGSFRSRTPNRTGSAARPLPLLRDPWIGASILAGLLLAAASRPQTASAFLMEPLENGVVGVTETLSGESVDKIRDTASLDAVRSCVGRIFWGPDLVIAQTLLNSYLEKSYSRFVKGIETLKTDFTAGRPQLTLRVYVDFRALVEDLQAKRFLFTPRPRPYFKVFLAEQLGGEFAKYSTGRDALAAALQDRNLRPFEGVIERPPDSTDVAADTVLLEDALIACERRAIELLFSGNSRTTRLDRKELYYDTYYFYRTDMEVAMIRVDTGEVLARAIATGTAGHTDEQQAIDLSITRAANEITNQLVKEFEKVWAPMVLNRANYHVLLTGVTPQTLSLVKDMLGRFSSDSKVYLRQTYDRTAVLNVDFPGKREDLLKAINTNQYPTLALIPEKTVEARLEATARTQLAQKIDISGRPVAPGQPAREGLFSYTYSTNMSLRLVDIATGQAVAEVAVSGKADGLEPGDVAVESWRDALSKALSDLNEKVPQSIHEVILRQAKYFSVFTGDEEVESKTLEERLSSESVQSTVDRRLRQNQWQVTLTYRPPENPDENLLGKDPFLPDTSLGASPRRSYLEIQVGE